MSEVQNILSNSDLSLTETAQGKMSELMSGSSLYAIRKGKRVGMLCRKQRSD